MDEALSRIARVSAEGASALRIVWDAGDEVVVELAGWIATGGDILAPLRDVTIFRAPAVGEYGAAVVWGDPDGDLAIDAAHLRLIAREQQPFTAPDLAAWQAAAALSNQEAADLLRVSVSQFSAWKAGAPRVPASIAMLCRAVHRDPLLMHAHYRPRKAGRPRKTA